MAFGQQSGPPATARQVRELLDLVQAAGHTGFRDARGPLRLTQRQAGGKFTRDEADELIDQLRGAAEAEADAESDADSDPATTARPVTASAVPPPRITSAERTARALPTDILAAELQRRGWAVIQP